MPYLISFLWYRQNIWTPHDVLFGTQNNHAYQKLQKWRKTWRHHCEVTHLTFTDIFHAKIISMPTKADELHLPGLNHRAYPSSPVLLKTMICKTESSKLSTAGKELGVPPSPHTYIYSIRTLIKRVHPPTLFPWRILKEVSTNTMRLDKMTLHEEIFQGKRNIPIFSPNEEHKIAQPWKS